MAESSAVTKLHVAYISMAFSTASETFARRDVEALRVLGHQVDVYSLLRTRGEGRLAFFARYCAGGFIAFLLPGIFLLAWRVVVSTGWVGTTRLKALILLPAAAQIVFRLHKNKPDIVHAFWGHYPALVILLANRYLPKVPCTIFLGAYDLDRRLPVSKWAVEKGAILFTHAHINVKDIHDFLGECALHVVHRGISLDHYPDINELDFTNRAMQVFTAGRLIKEKGFERLLQVFARAVFEHPGIRLVIAGTGPDQRRLLSLSKTLGIAGFVDFPGWLSEKQIRQQLLRSKVFMLLSYKLGERLPNALKEAMAAGCISVSSPTPGIDELIDNGINGFICNVNDISDLTAKISYAMYAKSATCMSVAAAQKIREKFDVRMSAACYSSVWLGLLKRRGSE